MIDINGYRLRNITLDSIDTLIEYLDSYRLSLRSDIQNLTSLLLLIIEDQYLLGQRLYLEILTENQIISRYLTTQSLKELFEFTDEYLYFLTEAIQSIEDSPYPSVSNREQASIVFPRLYIPGQEDIGITILSVHNDFLSSALNSPEIDSFRGKVSFRT